MLDDQCHVAPKRGGKNSKIKAVAIATPLPDSTNQWRLWGCEMLHERPASYIKSAGQGAERYIRGNIPLCWRLSKKYKSKTEEKNTRRGILGDMLRLSEPWCFTLVLMGLLSLSINSVHAAALKPEIVLDSGATILNHSMSLVQRLENLFISGNSSDVTLRVQTINTDEVKVLQSHSLVLSLQSDVFEDLLLTRNSSTLVLREAPDCAAVFDKFLRYFYSGDIGVRLEQAIALHKLASKYHVGALQQGMTQYMTQHLSSDSPSGHVVSWYNYALQIGDATLRDSCLQYLSWNLSSVLQSAEWGSISEDLLLSLLQRSDLILQSELELFEAVEAWINLNQPVSAIIESALRAIRYGMIPPQHLFRLQKQSPLFVKYYEAIRDLLYLAFQFHSASPIQLAKYFDVNCSLFTPRNYLSPSWGSSWVINNPTRDDRSFSFQTQLGPSGHDSNKRVTWNALFSPRWLPLSARSTYTELGAMQPTRTDGGRPRIIVTPATSSPDFAGVSFQKTVMVMTKQQGKVVVRHVYNFHQSTEEAGDFLVDADLQRRASEYLIDSSLFLHVVIKPVYHTLLVSRK